MSRVSDRFQIVNEKGLHARAATKVVMLASKYGTCEVQLEAEGQSANAKSVMGLLLLVRPKGSWVTVHAEGEGAAQCVEALGRLIAERFGEER